MRGMAMMCVCLCICWRGSCDDRLSFKYILCVLYSLRRYCKRRGEKSERTAERNEHFYVKAHNDPKHYVNLPSVFGIGVPEELEKQEKEERKWVKVFILYLFITISDYEIWKLWPQLWLGPGFDPVYPLSGLQGPKTVEATGFGGITTDQNAALCPVQTAALVSVFLSCHTSIMQSTENIRRPLTTNTWGEIQTSKNRKKHVDKEDMKVLPTCDLSHKVPRKLSNVLEERFGLCMQNKGGRVGGEI